MLKHFVKPVCLLLSVIVSGCQTAQAPDPKAITHIKTVHLRQIIAVPQEITYRGMADAFAGSVGGVIGGMAAESASGDRLEMQKSIQDHRIDMAAILRQEFVKTVATKGPFVIVADNVPADADLSLSVDDYGLGVGNTLSPDIHGLLFVTAVVTSPDGTVIWKDSSSVKPDDNANNVGYARSDFLAAPEHFTEAFVSVADIASARLLEDATNP